MEERLHYICCSTHSASALEAMLRRDRPDMALRSNNTEAGTALLHRSRTGVYKQSAYANVLEASRFLLHLSIR